MKIMNEYLTASFILDGAQLSSLIYNDREYIHDADPKCWGRHTPILFPFVGRLNNDKYTYEGIEYSMPQHGFLRDRTFELEYHTEDSIGFSYTSNASDLEIYPWEFKVIIVYTLAGKTIDTSYEIFNLSDSIMYYSVGGHPGFKLDNHAHKYAFELVTQDVLRMELDGPYINEEYITTLESFHYTEELIKNGALVFDRFSDKHVTITKDGEKLLTLHFEDFKYFAFWTHESNEGFFICLEPWNGHTDKINRNNYDITLKDGICTLNAKKSSKQTYTIEVH